MQELSTYYELAICRNPDDINGMNRDIWATFYHKISTDKHPQHSNCPEGVNSWCKYRVAEASGTFKNYKHPPALDDNIQPFLEKIYGDLSSDDLLTRCLGANTQNNNESFNSCVWHLAPKHTFSGKTIVEIATKCALCIYEKGFDPILTIMECMGITIGKAAAAFAYKRDNERINRADGKQSDASSEKRTQIRNE